MPAELVNTALKGSVSLRRRVSTQLLAHMLDSLVRVSRRVSGASHSARTSSSGPAQLTAEQLRTSAKTELRQQLPQVRALSCTAAKTSLTASSSTISSILTLFPKFFSSFLHSTCSLSVSCEYLALEEVYLPLRAAVPNYPTLGTPAVASAEEARGFHPLRRFFPEHLLLHSA